MKMIKILSVACMLLAVSVLGSACAKKVAPVETVIVEETTTTITAVETAVQAISDGVIYFAFNQYDISPEYREVLNQKAAVMRQYPNIRVRIEGHCDERGTQEYNLALGERRAKAAYEYLVLLGVNPNQLEIISYGKERPVVQGSGEEVWALNRRDNFKVIAR